MGRKTGKHGERFAVWVGDVAHKGRTGKAPTLNPPGIDPGQELESWEKWRKLPLKKRMMHMERVLERAGGRGDQDAVKSWLAHQRWKQEFTHGRPKSQRQDDGKGVSITIVDDIAGRRAVRIETSAAQEALPPPQEDATTEEDR